MSNSWHLGVDVGSVHVKVVTISPQGEHHSWVRPAVGKPLEVITGLLQAEIHKSVGNSHVCPAVTGIGQDLLAGVAGVRMVNEVMATAKAAAHLFPGIRTVVEIGGQFSKWIQLTGSGPNPHEVQDFATNGLCAAGTGAFLERQAGRLQISIEKLGQIANTSPKGCTIAGRCTVFAKSDMIHLQQKGTPTEEIAYGLCLALVRTFMTTVMHGRKITLPMLLVGGGATNPGLVRAFRDLLGSEEAIIAPEKPMCLGALGAAQIMRAEQAEAVPLKALIKSLMNRPAVSLSGRDTTALEPLGVPCQTVTTCLKEDPKPVPGPTQAFLGIDVGSVSTNLVLLNTKAELIQGIYLATRGEPLAVMNNGLGQILERYGHRLEILGVGVTGSGRYLAAQVLCADVVRNEITAQLTSTAHYFPDVDTVFEIGGQDSKYIEAKGGWLLDFEMNKICSAGTGSFLEEQAQRLGIDICEEFTEQALSSASPYDLGTQCTVFMDSELVHALQQGVSVDNLCAGLAYSVARNYLDKVVAGRPIGKTIVFQGGTASNGAVVAAFRKILGRKVQIHPYNRLSGAIGAALLAARQMECSPYKTNFAGFEACKVATVSSFECKGCENRCEVNRVTASGRTAHFGDICERYTEKDLYRSEAFERTKTRPFPELFALREDLLKWTNTTASSAEDGRVRVGIPKASLTLEFLPFWMSLVSELGFAPVVSARADPAKLAEMGRGVPAEVCLPLKAAAACVASLIHEQQVPFVFVPSLLECLPRKDGGQTHTCLYAQQFPDMLRAEYKDKLIHAQFAFGENPWDDLEGTMALVKAFNKPLHKVLFAMDKARKVYEQFVQAREKLGCEALKTSFDRAVVVMGKPYNTHDPGLNLFLARHLERLGLPAIPWDCLPLSQVTLSERWDTLPWHYSREQLRVLEFIRSDRRLFPVLLSNYGCGPDAFTVKHLEEMLCDRPRLFLEFDEHRGQAGLVTRLEAFADEMNSYIDLGTTWSATPKATRGNIPRPCGKRLFIPNFSEHAHIYAAVLRSAGLDAQVLPMPDAETLRLGEELSSGRECHPFSIILGELARISRSSELQKGDVFVSPSTTTPCLIRQYGDAYRILAERAQLPEIEIWDAAGREIGNVIGMSGLLRLYEGLSAVDFLYVLATRLRAYERQSGTVDDIFTDVIAKVSRAVANKRSVETELINGVRELLAMQRDGNPGDKPVIGVTGDLYTRINPVGNKGLFRHIENMGCEVWPSPYFVASVDITAWRDSRRDARRLHIKNAFWETLSWGITTGVLKRLFWNIDPYALTLATEQKPSRLVELAEPFVSEHTNWLVLLGVGKIADFIDCGVKGVINAVALHCMVGVAIDSALSLLRNTYTGTPIITLTYGGTEGPAQHVRLETFVHTVLERSKHGGATAGGTSRQASPS